MGVPGRTIQPPASSGPWFRQKPRQTLIVASAMFTAIFALRLTESGGADAVSVLYVMPVALLALAFGFRVGLAAGLGAVGLLVVGVLIRDVSLTPLGWSTRITPLLLLGTLVGFASDQLRESDRREQHYAEVALLQREAAEINDGVVQGLAAAKWLLEAGKIDRGLEAVNDTMLTAQALVSRMLGASSPLEGDRLRSRSAETPPPRAHDLAGRSGAGGA